VIARRRVLAAGAALALTGRRAQAVNRITLLVGAPEDSGIDRMARIFAPVLTRHLDGTEVGIRNIPGNGGLTALTALAEAPPSGATFGWVQSPTLSARMVDRAGPDLLDRLLLLGVVEREPITFVSPAATPLDSVQDIIQRSGEDAGAVPLGTPPPGSPPHLAALRLQQIAQTRLNIITFPSPAAARQAVIGGNVAAAALGLSDVIAALRDDTLVGLGIAAHSRAAMLPDLPVLSETGVDLSASIRRGVAAPAGLPSAIAERMRAALQAVTEDTDLRDQADDAGFLVAGMAAEPWLRQVTAERADLAKLWSTDPWLSTGGG
jgi:tripartite-type tricarboxylate transporter receptor subunit TctC